MNTIGTCSNCGGPVTSTDGLPKCSNCGAEAESANGPTIKMKSAVNSSMDSLRATLESVVDRWCPKINPDGKPADESFEHRMTKALLNVNAFEIDYRRVMAGGKALNESHPLPLPIRDKTLVS
jgi:uncharacterized Zn finger protein (UPF0148 family)